MLKNVIVSKSNKIVEARYKLSLLEQKFILMMVFLINPKDFKYYSFKIKEVADFLGIPNKNAYRDLKKIIIQLNKKTLIIKNDDDREQISSWVASAEYFKNEGIVEFEFSEKLKPYLLQLKEEFTSFRMSFIIQLKSSYSIRFYELLKQYEKIGKRTFSLENLKTMLGITENEYLLFANFNQRVIKIAQKELLEKTDISFKVEKIKRGKKVVGLNFYIKSEKKNKVPNLLEKIDSAKIKKIITSKSVNNKIAKIFEEINSNIIGLNRNTLLELSSKEWEYLSLEVKDAVIATGIDFDVYIKEKYEYVLLQMKKKIIENPVEFLLDSIKNNYGGLDVFNKKKKKLKLQMEKEKILELEDKIILIKKEKDETTKEIVLGIIKNDPTLLNNIVEQMRGKNKIFFKKFPIETNPLTIYFESLVIRANVNLKIKNIYENKFKKRLNGFNQKIIKLEKQIEGISKL